MEELIKKAQNGDKYAFTDIILQIRNDLYKIAKTRISNDSIIMEEDIVYKLYNQNTSYNSPKPFYND